MPFFLILAFLFAIGSTVGWGIEVLFRKFFSGSNPEHNWVNPGFLVGPCLPLYGFSLLILFLLAGLESVIGIDGSWLKKTVLFAIMALCITAVEYLTGLFCIRFLNVRLWDYSNLRWNIKGIICFRFTVYWYILSAIYYFLIHPHIMDALIWLSNNLAFSFFVGLYMGVFIIDVSYSAKLLPTIRRYAREQELTVIYEDLREHIRIARKLSHEKARFFLTMHTNTPFIEHLRAYGEKLRTQSVPDISPRRSKNGTKKSQ